MFDWFVCVVSRRICALSRSGRRLCVGRQNQRHRHIPHHGNVVYFAAKFGAGRRMSVRASEVSQWRVLLLLVVSAWPEL